jgi:predicted TIM-barrel fold metal-dependent hydrolase
VAQGRVAVFDAHLHIIDPRFPLVANQGYVPEPFTVDDYRAATAGMNVVGGAVVAGSFQGGSGPPWLLDALARLGPGFVGVVQLEPDVGDEEILALDAAGVRAVRFNLHRGGSLDEALAHRVHELAGWHAEVYTTDLPAHEARLRRLPRLVVDHLGMNSEGLAAAVRLGALVKATPRFDGDLRAVPPDKLLFGTDLPSTRAPRRFTPADVERVAAIAPSALADNARAWYRPRA